MGEGWQIVTDKFTNKSDVRSIYNPFVTFVTLQILVSPLLTHYDTSPWAIKES